MSTSTALRRRAIDLAERGRLPDSVIAAAARARTAAKVRQLRRGGLDQRSARSRALVERQSTGPITEHVEAANRQHYEVPTELFELMLGPHMKYSSAWWPTGVDTLEAAEEAMLALTCERADLSDGQRILELGCGWGSLTLWMAQHLPSASIVAVSNSATQKDFIDRRCVEAGIDNVTVMTCDVADLDPGTTFDRVVSVEMFEHVRNHRELLRRVASWLEPDGAVFVHVFSHREVGWHYDHTDDNDWMGQHFFTGGVMPSDDLLLQQQRDLVVDDHWILDGTHYARTLRAWLDNLDAHRADALAVLGRDLDADEAARWLQRWRMFNLVCAELWDWRSGTEFGVSHYRFTRR